VQNIEAVFVCLVFQGYVVCPSEKRFLLLFTFLRKNRNKKVMVFFSSCLEVKFFHELLNYIDIPVTCIHVSTTCSYHFHVLSNAGYTLFQLSSQLCLM